MHNVSLAYKCWVKLKSPLHITRYLLRRHNLAKKVHTFGIVLEETLLDQYRSNNIPEENRVTIKRVPRRPRNAPNNLEKIYIEDVRD